MRERFQLPIPMWRVQYQLQGGHRRLLAVCVIYTAVLIAGAVGFRRLMLREPLSSVTAIMLNALCGMQVLIVVFGGCNAIYRATLRDFETRMIESHRLTPMSNVTVTLGYLFGATLQIVGLCVINIAVGGVITAIGGYPVGPWFAGNLLLLSGAVPLWALFVFSGMRLAKPISPGPVLIGIGVLSFAFMMVPGGGLMLGVYSVILPFFVITGRVAVADETIAIVALVNVVLTCFWVYAAAAKYRRPDLPAINALRGLVLLSLWLLIAVGGVFAFEVFAPASMTGGHDVDLARGQWIATMAGSLILATIALSGAVQCRLLVARGASPRDWSDRVSDLTVALVAVGLIALVSAVVGMSVWRGFVGVAPDGNSVRYAAWFQSWAWTMGACALALLAVRGVLAFGHFAFKSPGIPVAMFILLTWAAPPLGDFIRATALHSGYEPLALSWLFGCSPIGTIVIAWSPKLDVALWPGLLLQLAIALLCTLLARRVWAREGAKSRLTSAAAAR